MPGRLGKMFRTCVVLGLIALVWPVVSYAQTCQVPAGLYRINAMLVGVSGARTPLSAETIAQFQIAMQNVSENSVLRDLRQQEMDEMSGVAVSLLAAASRISEAQPGAEVRNLDAVLNVYRQTLSDLCADRSKPLIAKVQQASIGAVIIEDGVNWSEVERLLRENEAMAFGLLVAMLASVIVLIFLADAGFRWCMAFVYNRKACRVVAVLTVSDQHITGRILTMGLGGCRFLPDDYSNFEQHLKLFAAHPVVFTVDNDLELHGTLTMVHDDVADFRFAEKITLRHQSDVLALSSISPFYVKKARLDERRPETDGLLNAEAEAKDITQPNRRNPVSS